MFPFLPKRQTAETMPAPAEEPTSPPAREAGLMNIHVTTPPLPAEPPPVVEVPKPVPHCDGTHGADLVPACPWCQMVNDLYAELRALAVRVEVLEAEVGVLKARNNQLRGEPC